VRTASTTLLIVALAAPPAGAQEREIVQLKNEIAAMGIKLGTLLSRHRDSQVEDRRRNFAERLTDAEILFLLGDYSRASLALYDLVDRRNQTKHDYPKAIYYLAESLFQIGHDLSAREFFQELVARRDRQHLSDAIRRLIEIADRNSRWEGLEEHVAVLERRGQLPPGIAYLRAKSLLRQGRAAAARETLKTIPADHDLGFKARYLDAVAALRAGDLDGARQAFARIVDTDTRNEDAARVRELAAMNEGRILLELGRHGESIDAYQFVTRSSPLFEEALFEVTWTYVRAADQAETDAQRLAEYKKAQNALEILLLAEAENPIAPEARLLLGNIHIKLGEYDRATTMFDDVVDRYAAPRDELTELAAQEIEPEAYFGAVSTTSEQRGLLPKLAVHWARGEPRLQQALAVLEGLEESEESLREADGITGKLLAQLESEQRLSFFPALQDAQATLLEYRNELVSLSRRLLDVERNLVIEGLPKRGREELERVLAERAELEPKYRALPQRKEEYEGRLSDMRRRMLAMQQQAYRLRYDIGSMTAQLKALRVWIGQNRDMIDDRALTEYRERIEMHEREVQDLEGLHTALEGEIDREKSQITLTSEEEAAEDQIRARYAATLDKEREILAGSGTLEAAAERQRVEVVREREKVAGFHAELERFEHHLNEMVGGEANSVRLGVMRERDVLERHRDAIARVRAEAERVIGEVAAGSLRDVKTRFDNIVLRADVGIVDVAWALKEVQTHEISRRVSDQRRELQVLDEEFSDVLAED
jgi:tetratricopeptide (TPR) repeat protein